MSDAAVATPGPWVPADTFASRLLLIRRELDLTTEEAAARCGLKAATWNTWENGSRPRGMDSVVAAIAKGLGVNRAWLMWGYESRATLSDKRGGAGQRLVLASSRETPDRRYRNAGSPLLVTI